MKKLELRAWDRMRALSILDMGKPKPSELLEYLPVGDKLKLSKKDKKEIGYDTTPNGVTYWQKPEHIFELEFADEEYEYLHGKLYQFYKTHFASDQSLGEETQQHIKLMKAVGIDYIQLLEETAEARENSKGDKHKKSNKDK